MSELKLLPCPFCGGPVELERTTGEYARFLRRSEWWGVVCRNTTNLGGTCCLEIRPSASKEAAVERWNTRATQPEATKPAQDLQLVVATSTETGFFHVVINVNDGKRSLVLYDKQHSLNGDTVGVADIPAAALASPADALVAGDRETAKDAERYRWLTYAGWIDDAIMETHGIREGISETLDAAIDRAIQAQKDGHG